MSRKRRGQRKREASNYKLKSQPERGGIEVTQSTIQSYKYLSESNMNLPEPKADRGSREISLIRTRRKFLGAMSAVALAAMGGVFGNIASLKWERGEQKFLSVERFFFLLETEQYPLAFNVGLDLLSNLSRQSREFVLLVE